MKRYISAILIPCLLIQFTGCYSYQNIKIEQLFNEENRDNITFVLNKGYTYEFKTKADVIINDTVANEHSNNDSTRLGIQILPRENELAVGGGFENTFGLYRMTVPFLSTVLVYNDPNNNNKFSASYTCLITGAVILIGGSIAYIANRDSEEVKNIIPYILLWAPILLANSEHHAMLLPATFNNPFEISLYVNSRTDLFEHWWRYVAGGGIQIGFNLMRNKNPYGGKWFGLQFGIEKAFLGNGIYNRDWVVYGGLRYFIHI